MAATERESSASGDQALRSRVKKAVLWACGLAVVVLVFATVAMWDALSERYWISKLESGDLESALSAADKLSGRHSVRAVRSFVRRIRATSTETAEGWTRSGNRWGGLERRVQLEQYTDVYVRPLALRLQGFGAEAGGGLEGEIDAIEREAVESRGTSSTEARADERTLHALRCVLRAWRDEKLEVHAEMPVQQQTIYLRSTY